MDSIICFNYDVLTYALGAQKKYPIETFLLRTHNLYLIEKKTYNNFWRLYEPLYEISNNVVCVTSKSSDQPVHTCRLCLSLEYYITFKLLTKHYLEFLSLKGGCTGLSESTPIKMPHCWKSHVVAQLYFLSAAINTNYIY